MPNKWTPEEEINLIKMLKEKKSLKEISRTLNRSENAVEQRINKIIYENIKNSGKTVESMSKALNMPVEDVNSYYEGRKTFLEQKLKGMAKEVGVYVDDKKSVDPKISEKKTEAAILQEGGKKDNKKEKLLNKLEYENRFIKALIENKMLHKQLNKLIKSGVYDPNIKLLLK